MTDDAELEVQRLYQEAGTVERERCLRLLSRMVGRLGHVHRGPPFPRLFIFDQLANLTREMRGTGDAAAEEPDR